MNKKCNVYWFLIGCLLSSQAVLAHDDLIYSSANRWYADYGNKGIIVEDGVHENGSQIFFGDYNGDGLPDMCTVRFEQSLVEWEWKLNDGSGGWTTLPVIRFGVTASDKAIVGDFNGDGKTDIAVFRNSSSSIFASWYIDFAPCDGNYDARGNFGLNNDIPLSGDFNADGVDDLCVYRPSDGTWYVAFSAITGYPDFISPLAINGLHFGETTDIPVVGDFNGDGYADMALYRKNENKVLVNLHDRSKPKFERFADRNGKGTVDMQINSPILEQVLQVMCMDKDNSRPTQLPPATESEFGTEVNLRHGWTCIFDNSLDVDKWIQAWQAAGINTLEYHPWMRAHEEIAPVGDTWNTYVGDDRLWTSKRMMKEKINRFRAIGGRSIGYTGIYAATPAFANKYPNWAMRNVSNNDFIVYGNGYLNIMGTNEQINYPYEINGVTFKNFNDYFVYQAEKAQQEYNWDGWRWDWYGLPDRYACTGLSGEGNFTYEMSPLVDRLNLAVKNLRPDCTTTALQLPTASGDLPNQLTAAVVDHQFMELWPFATGQKYTDLYNDIYKAKSKYPDKPVFANFYPPAEMNLTTSWPLMNIDYQFATSIVAGGYPAATLVDGVAGFTDPVPFHAVNYPQEVLERIAKWNDFLKAYGPYFFYSNPSYLITDYTEGNLNISGASDGLFVKLKKRRDKRTRQQDLLILDAVNYGNSSDLKWVERNSQPARQNFSAELDIPAGFIPGKAYLLTLNGREEISYTTSSNKLQVSLSNISFFASLVITSEKAAALPDAPVKNPVEFPEIEFGYDAAGETMRVESTDYIAILEDQAPLEVVNRFGENVASWEFISDANSGEKAVRVTPGMLTIPSTSEGAVRVPINKFRNFNVSIRSNDSKATWIGFRLIKPSDTSPVWQSQDLFYRIGFTQPGLAYVTIYPLKPQAGVWKEYTRDLQADAITLFGEDWRDAIVTAVHYGPVEDGTADYDGLIFTADTYSDIEKVKKKDDKVVVYPNPLKGELLTIKLDAVADAECYRVRLLDLLGRPCAVYDVDSEDGQLVCKLPGLVQGYYLLQISNENSGVAYSTVKIKYE